MNKIRIGVLCPSEIAFRRFMPALMKNDKFEFIGISSANKEEWFGTPTDELISIDKEKANHFIEEYGGKYFESYSQLLSAEEIDAVYIPLPPALHFKWAKGALKSGKHILVEKPFTTSAKDTAELIQLAKEKSLAVHENYMFVYHSQLDWIIGKQKEIGEVRLYRIDFGFPFRGGNDFRYDKALGGGALLDAGGYTLKLGNILLGENAKVVSSKLNYRADLEVDIYGSATMENSDGVTAQISFGMDNAYKCSLEIWGSEGVIFTNRIFTAPNGYEPVVTLKKGNDEQSFTLPADDTFGKSIAFFAECVGDVGARAGSYEGVLRQGGLVDAVMSI